MRTAQSVRSLLFCCLLVPVASIASAQTSTKDALYARTNSFGLFAAYSNDSSHILLGNAEQRKELYFGASYSRRILLNRKLNWQYDGEILPWALNSDPVETDTFTYMDPKQTFTTTDQTVPVLACTTGTISIVIPPTSFTVVTKCSRRWVMGGGVSPVGFRWNLLPRHSMQPFFVGHGGFMESVNAIPVRDAGSFNFSFDFGAGLEWYHSHSRSWRMEYRYHHISNKNTAPLNPGIDSGLFQVSYVFGR